jgi:hypothetical protein
MNKIPLVVLIYKEVEIIKSCLSRLVTDNFYGYYDQFDIYVVENKSENSKEIEKFVFSQMEAGHVHKYIQFEKNISNNAIQKVFDDGLIDLNSEYIVVTDGDLVPDYNWFKEHKSILDNNKDVFVISNTLDSKNLPLNNFPQANLWIGIGNVDRGEYIESRTGTHLFTFRTADFKRWLDYRLHNNLKFCDVNIHDFGYKCLMKKSARTKETKSYHLTWDLYQDINHPYTREKMLNPNIFNHDEFCNYEVFK